MKNKIQQIKQSWTYNHKSLIIIASLLVALYYPAYIAPYIPTSEAVEWVAVETQAPYSLESELEARALELYNENRAIDLEKYRHEAIRETSDLLMGMTYESPYIDYEALKEKHGY